MAWLAFKTDSSDMRTCGVNVRPSSNNATITRFTATGRYALNGATLTCASATLSAIASAEFTAALPAVQSLGYGLPAACTPVFSKPLPEVGSADGSTCKSFLAFSSIKNPDTTNKCPCEWFWMLGAGRGCCL